MKTFKNKKKKKTEEPPMGMNDGFSPPIDAEAEEVNINSGVNMGMGMGMETEMPMDFNKKVFPVDETINPEARKIEIQNSTNRYKHAKRTKRASDKWLNILVFLPFVLAIASAAHYNGWLAPIFGFGILLLVLVRSKTNSFFRASESRRFRYPYIAIAAIIIIYTIGQIVFKKEFDNYFLYLICLISSVGIGFLISNRFDVKDKRNEIEEAINTKNGLPGVYQRERDLQTTKSGASYLDGVANTLNGLGELSMDERMQYDTANITEDEFTEKIKKISRKDEAAAMKTAEANIKRLKASLPNQVIRLRAAITAFLVVLFTIRILAIAFATELGDLIDILIIIIPIIIMIWDGIDTKGDISLFRLSTLIKDTKKDPSFKMKYKKGRISSFFKKIFNFFKTEDKEKIKRENGKIIIPETITKEKETITDEDIYFEGDVWWQKVIYSKTIPYLAILGLIVIMTLNAFVLGDGNQLVIDAYEGLKETSNIVFDWMGAEFKSLPKFK